MSDTGWIKLHRQITDCWLWDDRPYSKGQAWIDLLLLTNYKDRKEPYGNGIRTFQRGTVNLSQMQLANRWGWDRRTVKRFLTLLESDNMITQESTTHGTTITLVNYDKFNDYGTTNSTSDSTTGGATDSTSNTQPNVQLAPTTKKDKKDKKVEEGKESKKIVRRKFGEYKHVLLSDDEYNRLIRDYGEQAVIDGIQNVDEYCQGYGKTYSDYNLVLRKWGIKSPKLDKPVLHSTETEIDEEEAERIAHEKFWNSLQEVEN